jgi:hypothetical protein
MMALQSFRSARRRFFLAGGSWPRLAWCETRPVGRNPFGVNDD